MAQLRAHLYKTFNKLNADGVKVPIVGASAKICTPNTTNIIGQTIYADDSSGTVLANPLTTDSSGSINCYVLNAQTVDIILSGSDIAQATFRANFEPYNSGV